MAHKSGPAARRTRTNKSAAKQIVKPYDMYRSSALWKPLEQGIADLVENQDIQETTDRYYIVGYLCKILSRQKS